MPWHARFGQTLRLQFPLTLQKMGSLETYSQGLSLFTGVCEGQPFRPHNCTFGPLYQRLKGCYRSRNTGNATRRRFERRARSTFKYPGLFLCITGDDYTGDATHCTPRMFAKLLDGCPAGGRKAHSSGRAATLSEIFRRALWARLNVRRWWANLYRRERLNHPAVEQTPRILRRAIVN